MKCKLFGHNIQCMTPPGAEEEEIWACTNKGCTLELDEYQMFVFVFEPTRIQRLLAYIKQTVGREAV